ncbi:QacE family quaternary ammonium compound efflux SMR transporter [Flavobacterium piscis]|jgi:small multidrug resistance pump|uniref:Multidrug transporter n=2 Tax=Flavobacterium TaxID=237 RepID=A0ABX2XQA4_9FLAO|nr:MULTISPECIES: SMR family transporter [Flavobacterium]MCC9063075.1 SMR family transporter [Flavobacterium sp. F-30]OCB77502.1 multidrug transporter [Flavobacterium piscis]OXG05911.1 QacE family quaternary ammonium compound efflux SMR transporter [Flavobacterium piscis]QDW20063.1 QacE family quaternary ammonium compound efflux SMR transporter [Flavobacterium sp. KBS0721]
MKNFFFLGIAIIFEIIATSALKKSEQFTQIIPSIITIVGYFAAFYFLSFAIRTIPVGIAYAIWSGVGIVLITIIGAVFFKQIPDLPAIIGLALIMIGVVVINVFSKTTAH